MIHKPREWTKQEIIELSKIFDFWLHLDKWEEVRDELVKASLHPAARILVQGCYSCGKNHYIYELNNNSENEFWFTCPNTNAVVGMLHDTD